MIPVNWYRTGNGSWTLQQAKLISSTDVAFYPLNFFPNKMSSCASLLRKVYMKMPCSEKFCKILQPLCTVSEMHLTMKQ